MLAICRQLREIRPPLRPSTASFNPAASASSLSSFPPRFSAVSLLSPSVRFIVLVFSGRRPDAVARMCRKKSVRIAVVISQGDRFAGARILYPKPRSGGLPRPSPLSFRFASHRRRAAERHFGKEIVTQKSRAFPSFPEWNVDGHLNMTLGAAQHPVGTHCPATDATRAVAARVLRVCRPSFVYAFSLPPSLPSDPSAVLVNSCTCDAVAQARRRRRLVFSHSSTRTRVPKYDDCEFRLEFGDDPR